MDNSYLQPQPGPSQVQAAASSSNRSWKENDLITRLQDIKRPLQLHEGYDEEFYDDEDPSEEGDDRFFNPALLSHIAVRLRDKVPRGTHVKGSIPYERAFTGKDIVVSQDCLWFASRTQRIHLSVYDPIANPARSSYHTWDFDQRSPCSYTSCAKPAIAALLLRS